MNSTLGLSMNKAPWNYILSESPLMNWQKTQVLEATSELEAQCLLKAWLRVNYTEIIKESFCNPIWDDVYCWPPTPPETVVTRLCSEILRDVYPEHSVFLEGNVTRKCLGSATWDSDSQVNYTKCSESYEKYFAGNDEDDSLVSVVQHMLFIGSILSLICLGISLAIFSHYRCLWSTRVYIQIHLIVSLIFRFILMFVIAEPFIFNRESNYRDVFMSKSISVMKIRLFGPEQDIICKSILVLFLYATLASVGWMFVQGLYLNVKLMGNMTGVDIRYHFRIYTFIGWAVPVFITFVYVVAMISKNENQCWEGYAEMKEMWILVGPIMFEVVANGIFLLNVLRILLRTIRNSNSQADVSQIKAAAKATAVLFPVLGINNLFLMHNPGGMYHKFFVSLNTFFGSTQGIFVAMVCCFLDKDVRLAVRRSLDRANARRNFGESRNNNGEQTGMTMDTLQPLGQNGNSLTVSIESDSRNVQDKLE